MDSLSNQKYPRDKANIFTKEHHFQGVKSAMQQHALKSPAAVRGVGDLPQVGKQNYSLQKRYKKQA